ncbi:uncharacterized protein LOC125666452 [Ostrea edulis]|uniref:uncharacterized protein LOC125666452 n=1 Tax=Ostrea edulis TaxID=37623 RepID=UPI0024AF278E|nr:uncharacterized protein LOC125666452 [Ostrea edulis]
MNRALFHFLKTSLALGLGLATIFLILNWSRSDDAVIQTKSIGYQQTSPSATYVPTTSPKIKRKPTKCGETDSDFNLSGIETVKPLIDRVSPKFRSKDLSCQEKNFPKPYAQLTAEENQRKQECIKNWNKDYNAGFGSFWTGTTQYIRHTHHTYLNADSTIFDIGGNKGEDADAMIKRYRPNNYLILEPIKTLYSNLVKKFKNDSKVELYNFGLARKNDKFYVNVWGNGGDATSVFAGNDDGGSCLLRVVNTTRFLLQAGVPCYEIDLITVNCEGCEFEIMEELIGSGMMNQFRHVQFATHPTLKHLLKPAERYCEIQEKLKRTHTMSYQYKWCWESWKRKDLV